jgi:hypothetical protein
MTLGNMMGQEACDTRHNRVGRCGAWRAPASGPLHHAALVTLIAHWPVDILRHRAEHLGTVEAAGHREGSHREGGRAVRDSGKRRNRIGVQKVGKDKD